MNCETLLKLVPVLATLLEGCKPQVQAMQDGLEAAKSSGKLPTA